MKPSFVTLFVCFVSACGSASAGPNPDVCSDGYRDEVVRRSTPAPDGDGWCCFAEIPIAASYTGGTGGWASDFCECGQRHLYDAPPCAYSEYVDSHGCRGYQYRLEGCGTPPPDAGSDASIDVPDADLDGGDLHDAAAPDAGD